MIMKYKNKQNPFLMPFIIFALLCCILLSLEFFSFFHSNNTRMQQEYYQKKTEVLMNDLELHLETLNTMAFRFSTDTTYKHSVLTEKKYNEILLLEDFSTHKYDCSLTEELFLHYGGKNIHHVNKYTVLLDVYLNSLTETEKINLTKALKHPDREPQILSATDALFIIIPFKVGYGNDSPQATLTAVVSLEQLEERFQIVSGGLDGTISLYADKTLLYSSHDTPCTIETENVLTSSTQDGQFTICYLPAPKTISILKLLLEIGLILLDMLLILLIAHVFSANAYKPLDLIWRKYQPKDAQPSGTEERNIFAEIENIIDTAHSNYQIIQTRLDQKNEQLKQELLRQLLTQSHSLDIQKDLDALGFTLPGPFYYVISVVLTPTNFADDILPLIKKALERVFNSNPMISLHIVCDNSSLQLWIICNLSNPGDKAQTTKFIREFVEQYSSNVYLGVGRIYNNLNNLSASWLESIDNMNNERNTASLQSQNSIYDFSNMKLFEEALSNASLEDALNWLKTYTQKLDQQHLSPLMQQCIFTEIIGTLSKLSKRNNITLSNQNLSLIISARNTTSFYEAAHKLILEYCDKYHSRLKACKEDLLYQICQYINEHFMEYNISIELIAENLGVTTATVREAILISTGKPYKDYLVFLRMEYAKELLLEGEMSVAEVSNAVGYSSVSYFIRLFKNTHGITPAKFTKKTI